MANLQELILFLIVVDKQAFIDGTYLHDQVLVHMPDLKKFTFSIRTSILTMAQDLHLLSNDEVQCSLIEHGIKNAGSYVDHYPNPAFIGECHIYTLPYAFDTLLKATNSLPSGVFNIVRLLGMLDRRPFEHDFFERIARQFPSLKSLIVQNGLPQKNKQARDKNQSSAIITFPHVTHLDLSRAHADYAEQFLLETNSRLPSLFVLCVKYEPLAIATNNFTSDAARVHCAQVKHLVVKEPIVAPKDFHLYFPL
jgi:hypothetical protein